MKYYNPFSTTEIETCKRELEADGFEVYINPVVAVSLKRENNKYKKCLKWHVEGRTENGCHFSEWFKTKNAAIYDVTRARQPFNVGGRFSLTPMQWKEG